MVAAALRAEIPTATVGAGDRVPPSILAAVMASERRVRVLHVITRLCVGGAQLSLLELARALHHTHDIEIAYGPDIGTEGSIEEEVLQSFPRATMIPALRRPIRPGSDALAVVRLRALFRKLRPDVVHTHSSKAGIVGRFAGRDGPWRVVHTVHGRGHTPDDSVLRRRMLVAAERRAAGWCHALVAVSPDVVREGLDRGIGDPELYRVIPNPVDSRPVQSDFASARRKAREVLGLDPSSPVVGWVGRFMPQKDPLTLARVVDELLRENSRATAVFIGDGPERTLVEAELNRSGQASRALFTGFRRDVRELYAAMDVLLHTSRWEGQPRVIHEALAERIPVVAASVTGTPEIFQSGRVGFEVTPGDTDAFVRCAQSILRGESVRAPLPDRAIDDLDAVVGRQVSVRRHISLYAELLSCPPASRPRVIGGVVE